MTSAELSVAAPRIDKTADAEAFFWDVRVYDMIRSLPYVEHHVEHYIRIKVFNERGVKDHATVHIPYDPAVRQTLSDVRARTIKPDGTIRELQKDAVFDRTDVKIGNKTLRKTRSFAMPDVTAGSILEYQWHETFSEYLPRYVRLEFQRDIPIQKVTYYVRPLSHEFFSARMRVYPFNCEPAPFALHTEGANHYHVTSIENVPAFVEEPDAPAALELRQWMLLYYTSDETTDPKKYWPKLGKRLQDQFEQRIKVNGDVKALAAQAVEGAGSPEEKLRRLADFCRTQVKNLVYQNSGLTAEERQAFKVKDTVTSADTAKSKKGFPEDINILFAAMARAQGFEVRGVRVSSQVDGFFRMDLLDPYFLREEVVAVKSGDSWKYFNVGNPYVPAGMLPWYQNEVPGLLLDDKKSELVTLPAGPPASNTITRTAKLTLSEDGTLQGTVEVTVDGLGGAMRKSYLEDLSDAKRKEDFEEDIRRSFGDVDISGLTIENVTDPNKPLVYRYGLTVRGYAERTGKRLFLQPAFFQHGKAARFVAKERKHSLLFRYPYQEKDNVVITLPEGYELEKAEGVPPLAIGKTGNYDLTLQVTKDGRRIIATRTFTWGENSQIYFPATAYPLVKAAWDEIHHRDGHTLAVKAKQ